MVSKFKHTISNYSGCVQHEQHPNYKFRGLATSAEYADLAERYAADAEYDKGTVVRIGGTHEITQTMQHADTDVFGIVSTASVI